VIPKFIATIISCKLDQLPNASILLLACFALVQASYISHPLEMMTLCRANVSDYVPLCCTRQNQLQLIQRLV
jgi:hypothetical protein